MQALDEVQVVHGETQSIVWCLVYMKKRGVLLVHEVAAPPVEYDPKAQGVQVAEALL